MTDVPPKGSSIVTSFIVALSLFVMHPVPFSARYAPTRLPNCTWILSVVREPLIVLRFHHSLRYHASFTLSHDLSSPWGCFCTVHTQRQIAILLSHYHPCVKCKKMRQLKGPHRSVGVLNPHPCSHTKCRSSQHHKWLPQNSLLFAQRTQRPPPPSHKNLFSVPLQDSIYNNKSGMLHKHGLVSDLTLGPHAMCNPGDLGKMEPLCNLLKQGCLSTPCCQASHGKSTKPDDPQQFT